MSTPRAGCRDRWRSFYESRRVRDGGRLAPRPRRLGLEPLEDRRLLSLDFPPLPPEPVDPLGSLICDSPVPGDIAAPGGTDRLTIDLDQRETVTLVADRFFAEEVVPDYWMDSRVGSRSWVDQGDCYWANGRMIPLWRRTDEVVVGLRAGSDQQHLAAELATAEYLVGGLETQTPRLHGSNVVVLLRADWRSGRHPA